MIESKTKAHPIIKMGLLSLLVFCCSQIANAQICGPAEIDYIIRDSKGRIIDPSTLKPSDFVKESVQHGERRMGTISFLETGDAKNAAKVKSLNYRGGANCRLMLDELTLQMGGKTMRLIFNLSLNSYEDSQHSRRVIDSLPFEQGTFRLEATSENNIPASRWKKVSRVSRKT